MIDVQKVEELIRNADNIIAAVKATGGYRYRDAVRLPDEELDRFVERAEPVLRGMVLRLFAAERVLEDWGRTAEYGCRLDEIKRLVAQAQKQRSAAACPEPARPTALVSRRLRRHPPRKPEAS